MFIYLLTMAAGGVITYLICEYVIGYGVVQLFIRAIVCIIVPNVVFIITNFKRKEFKDTVQFIKGIVKR